MSFALVALLAGLLAAASANWHRTGDFYCLWSAARIVAAGADPYDEALWEAEVFVPTFDRHGRFAPPPCPGRFGYPLWTAMALLPLAPLALPLAATIWMAANIAGIALGAALAWRAVRGPPSLALAFAVIVVVSQPAMVVMDGGQIGGILALLTGALAWAASRGRERTSGALLVLLALKPQVTTLLAPALLARAAVGRRRCLVGAVPVGAALLGASLLLRPAWPLEWLAELGGRRLTAAPLLPTAWGLAADLTGEAGWGLGLLALTIGAVAMALRGRRVGDLELVALLVPLSLYAAPYAWSYDWVVFIVPWAFLLARADLGGRWRIASLAGVLALASLAPWVMYAYALARGGETMSAIIPAAMSLAVALAIPRARSSGASRRLGDLELEKPAERMPRPIPA